jgi:type IV pilus assembly protein PilW
MKPQARPQAIRARGFSLIELMVALVINLAIVIAAATLYLNSSDTRRALAEQQSVDESGQYALDMIGRTLVNAGFYPAIRPLESGRNNLQADSYTNVVAGAPAAFDSGVYGCSGMRFQGQGCSAHPSSSITADTLVVNYFTNDAMGSKIGHRMDCAGGNVSLTAENSTRVDDKANAASYSNNNLGRSPKTPLWVSARFTLNPASFNHEGQSIKTASLACSGNRSSAYMPAINGIEDLQFLYGVYTDPETRQAAAFYSANQMAGLASLEVDGQTKNAWSRVSSVEVCLLVRGLSPTKLSSSSNSSATSTYIDCKGMRITTEDHFIRRVYRKIFALRNNLTQTILP